MFGLHLFSFFFSLFVLRYGCSCIHVHEKNVSGGARQAIPGQHCFELISSHQQGIRTACLAHHRFIYAGATRTHVHVCMSTYEPLKAAKERPTP